MSFQAKNVNCRIEGCVHGRFQPPHLGHQEYIHGAMKKCEFLWIGIARPDIQENLPCSKAQHREEEKNNPLTFFERIQIIHEMVLDLGAKESQFGFVPFPIDQPERLKDFLNVSVVCFTTIYDDWNRYKIDILKAQGYKVEILWEREHKQYNGQTIRESIRIGTSDWEKMVPPATLRNVKNLNLRERLNKLSSL